MQGWVELISMTVIWSPNIPKSKCLLVTTAGDEEVLHAHPTWVIRTSRWEFLGKDAGLA
jgi:hypothetical protein